MVPASAPTFYAYVVVNTAAVPPEPVKIEMSRRECREFVKWQPNADALKVRRARVVLYQK